MNDLRNLSRYSIEMVDRLRIQTVRWDHPRSRSFAHRAVAYRGSIMVWVAKQLACLKLYVPNQNHTRSVVTPDCILLDVLPALHMAQEVPLLYLFITCLQTPPFQICIEASLFYRFQRICFTSREKEPKNETYWFILDFWWLVEEALKQKMIS